LHNQNAALALEIAQLENLSRVETRARELGLGPTTSVRYLPVSNYPASENADSPAAAIIAPRPDPIEMFDEPSSPLGEWWDSTLDKVTAWLAEE
jgi:hypothetical protein